MRIKIDGLTENKEHIEKLIYGVADVLEFADSDIEIEVEFEKDYYAAGDCFSHDEFNFEIGLSLSLNWHELVKTIIHEMAHVKQYYTGRLIEKEKYVIWEGKKYPKTLDYLVRPWETEAYKIENELFSLLTT